MSVDQHPGVEVMEDPLRNKRSTLGAGRPTGRSRKGVPFLPYGRDIRYGAVVELGYARVSTMKQRTSTGRSMLSSSPGRYVAEDYAQVLDDHHVLASVGTVGDCYDNALAESFVDSYKTELIADRSAPS